MGALAMTMQYRYDWSGKPTPWVDFEAGLVEFDAYLVEIREKPDFVPGWYARTVSSGRYDLIYCKHHTPVLFPDDWFLVGEDFLEKNLGFDPDRYDDCG
jgi:hypothetical protein